MDSKPRKPLVDQRHDLEDFTDVARTTNKPDSSNALVSFSGKRGALLKIALVNALLTILTLGFYRFWAKTRLRRYFWSNIKIQNEPLEYTGTAMELLIGFFVVLAILVPIFALYEGALFLAQSSPEWATHGLNIFYGFALFAFFQYAFYRMWRYRFSRTTWRGIRFEQKGSAWKYMVITLAWMAVTVVTFGAAYPWLRNAQWKYRIKNLNYGKSNFDYTGTARNLATKWLICWVTPLGIIGVGIALELEFISSAIDQLEPNPTSLEFFSALATKLETFFILISFSMLLFTALYIWYRVIELRYVLSNIGFSDARFVSKMRVFSVYLTLILNGLIIAIVIGIPFALIQYAVVNHADKIEALGFVGFVVPALMVVYFIVALSVVTTVVFYFGILKNVFSNLEITNVAAFDQISQSKEQNPEFGEGLADALDVGAF